jgi:hypothetical protein
MPDINKFCGTCAYWQQEEREEVSPTITMQSKPPLCTVWKKIKYAEGKPLSWCHKEATPEQLASRVKAGLIGEGN